MSGRKASATIVAMSDLAPRLRPPTLEAVASVWAVEDALGPDGLLNPGASFPAHGE